MSAETLLSRLRKLVLRMSLSATVLAVVVAIGVKRYPVATVHFVDDMFTFVNRRTATTTHRRHIEGNFEPVRGPLSTTDRLTVVSGALPPDLAGTYIRNGPNLMFYPPRAGHHMFDGESFPHRVRLEGGEAVRYDRSWLDTPRFKALQAYGREAYPSFGDVTRGGYSFLAKFALSKAKIKLGLVPDVSPELTATHSTSIIAHHGKLFAAVESAPALSFELGLESGGLRSDPAGPQPFEGTVEGVEQKTVFSAHPKICPRTGDMYFVAMTPRTQQASMMGFNHVSRGGKLLKSLTVPVADDAGTTPMHVHDFWLTEHFAVVYDLSLRIDAKQVLKGGKLISWHPEDTMRLGVVPRDTDSFADDVVWCDTGSPGFIWHVINGWETSLNGSKASIALFAPKFDYYPGTVPIHTPEEPPSYLTRWDLVVNFADKRCAITERRLRNEIVERPSTNLRFHGSPRSKWGYLRSEGTAESASMGGAFLKVDLTTGELAATFACGEGGNCVTGEALFVPKNSGAAKDYPFAGPEGVSDTEAEDDGYLMDIVYYPEGRNASEFVVWDAAASGLAKPIARVTLPERVPYGVHAWFAPSHLYSTLF